MFICKYYKKAGEKSNQTSLSRHDGGQKGTLDLRVPSYKREVCLFGKPHGPRAELFGPRSGHLRVHPGLCPDPHRTVSTCTYPLLVDFP